MFRKKNKKFYYLIVGMMNSLSKKNRYIEIKIFLNELLIKNSNLK